MAPSRGRPRGAECRPRSPRSSVRPGCAVASAPGALPGRTAGWLRSVGYGSGSGLGFFALMAGFRLGLAGFRLDFGLIWLSFTRILVGFRHDLAWILHLRLLSLGF